MLTPMSLVPSPLRATTNQVVNSRSLPGGLHTGRGLKNEKRPKHRRRQMQPPLTLPLTGEPQLRRSARSRPRNTTTIFRKTHTPTRTHIPVYWHSHPLLHQAVQVRLRRRFRLLLELGLLNFLPRQHPPLVLLPDGVAARVYRQEFGARPLRVRHFFRALSELLSDLRGSRRSLCSSNGNGGKRLYITLNTCQKPSVPILIDRAARVETLACAHPRRNKRGLTHKSSTDKSIVPSSLKPYRDKEEGPATRST